MTAMATEVSRIAWDDAMREMKWKQGEHVTLIGPTGGGKTEAMIALLSHRKWVVFLTTKKNDSTSEVLTRQMGYRATQDPEAIHSGVARRWVYRVPWNESMDYDKELLPLQTRLVKRVLTKLFQRGAWTVAIDELPYIDNQMGLRSTLRLMWLQGRSGGVSIIANTQRPRNVPLEAYSQASHLFIWNTPDSQDIVRAGDLVALDRRRVGEALSSLARHDILYYNVLTGKMFVTNTRW